MPISPDPKTILALGAAVASWRLFQLSALAHPTSSHRSPTNTITANVDGTRTLRPPPLLVHLVPPRDSLSNSLSTRQQVAVGDVLRTKKTHPICGMREVSRPGLEPGT